MSDSTYMSRSETAKGQHDPHGEAGQRGGSPADGSSAGACGMLQFEQDILSLLSRVVKRDIVPTLITANRVIGQDEDSPAAQAWHDGGFNAERGERDIHFTSASIRMVDVARFVRLLRSAGVDAAPALVEVLLARGIARNEIYLELLGPAARMIGDMWQDDECSFADVTMVVGRLHNILNSLRGERVVALSSPDSATILLSPAPGEQHSFGIAVVDAVFQDAGWQTSLSYTNDADDLIDQVSRRRFDAIGLSLSSDSLSDVLRATIMRLRAASANPDLVVLVGGPAFEASPQLAAYAGADAMVGKGVAAAARARELLPRHLALSV